MHDTVSESPLSREITLAVPEEKIQQEVRSRLLQLSRTAKLAGFRPGKVPMRVVEKRYSKQVQDEVLWDLVSAELNEALKAQGLRPVSLPTIEPVESSTESARQFKALFEILPEVVVADLSDAVVEKPVIEITDADVDAALSRLRKNFGTWVAVERPAQEGDRLVITFSAKEGETPLELFQGENVPIELDGRSRFDEIFRSALLGMRAGEEKTFAMTFSEGYVESLRGKTADVTVQVRSVETLEPEDDDQALATKLGLAEPEKIRDELKKVLQRQVKKEERDRLLKQITNIILSHTDFELPKSMVHDTAHQLAQNLKERMRALVQNVDEIPISEETVQEDAEKLVKTRIAFSEIVRQYQLQAKPEKIRELVEEAAAEYENPEEVVLWFYEDPKRLEEFESRALEDELIQWVLSKARVEEKPMTVSEILEKGNTNG
jgi:trigger factor